MKMGKLKAGLLPAKLVSIMRPKLSYFFHVHCTVWDKYSFELFAFLKLDIVFCTRLILFLVKCKKKSSSLICNAIDIVVNTEYCCFSLHRAILAVLM